MKVLTVSAFAIIALLGARGDAAAMASNYHRHSGGEGGHNGGGHGTTVTDLQTGPDAPGRDTVAVPEPGTLTLTGLGLGAVAVFLRKSKRRVTQTQDGRAR